jgi:hypothetical protein
MRPSCGWNLEPAPGALSESQDQARSGRQKWDGGPALLSSCPRAAEEVALDHHVGAENLPDSTMVLDAGL